MYISFSQSQIKKTTLPSDTLYIWPFDHLADFNTHYHGIKCQTVDSFVDWAKNVGSFLHSGLCFIYLKKHISQGADNVNAEWKNYILDSKLVQKGCVTYIRNTLQLQRFVVHFYPTVLLCARRGIGHGRLYRWTENSFPFFLYLKPVEISKKCFNITWTSLKVM